MILRQLMNKAKQNWWRISDPICHLSMDNLSIILNVVMGSHLSQTTAKIVRPYLDNILLHNDFKNYNNIDVNSENIENVINLNITEKKQKKSNNFKNKKQQKMEKTKNNKKSKNIKMLDYEDLNPDMNVDNDNDNEVDVIEERKIDDSLLIMKKRYFDDSSFIAQKALGINTDSNNLIQHGEGVINWGGPSRGYSMTTELSDNVSFDTTLLQGDTIINLLQSNLDILKSNRADIDDLLRDKRLLAVIKTAVKYGHEEFIAIWSDSFAKKPFKLSNLRAFSYMLSFNLKCNCQLGMDDALALWLGESLIDMCEDEFELDPTYIYTVSQLKQISQKNFDDRTLFPLRPYREASTKCNIFLRDAVLSLYTDDKYSYSLWLSQAANWRGLTNDQATAALIAGHAWHKQGFKNSYVLSGYLSRNSKKGKYLSDLFKRGGVAGNILASSLIENNSLSGKIRGADFDWLPERRKRLANYDLLFKPDLIELRKHIKEAISHELREQPMLESEEDFLNHLWATCVNGSHNAALSRQEPDLIDLPETLKHRQLYKRAFVECLSGLPFNNWDSRSYITASIKSEVGQKCRAIYSLDTRNYLAFDYIMKSVEKVWRHRRIVLSPGHLRPHLIHERLNNVNKNKVLLSLDYTDFNAQHQLESLKIVVEELTEGWVPMNLRRKLIESVDNMFLVTKEGLINWEAGLPSGHRLTTLWNSVLNDAYMRYVQARVSTAPICFSIAVGDDAVIAFNHYKDCEKFLNVSESIGLGVNPSKQSYGQSSTEFLRHNYSQTCVVGYLCRSIGSLVTGSWVSEIILGELEGASVYTNYAWALFNRSGGILLGPLLLHSMVRRVPGLSKTAVLEILRLRASLNGSPVYRNWGVIDVYRSDASGRPKIKYPQRLPLNATNRYITNCIQPIEWNVINDLNLSIRSLMQDASYRKIFNVNDTSRVIWHHSRVMLPFVRYKLEDLEKVGSVDNPLGPYPILLMLQDKISDTYLLELSVRYGIDINDYLRLSEAKDAIVCLLNNCAPTDAARMKSLGLSGLLSSNIKEYV